MPTDIRQLTKAGEQFYPQTHIAALVGYSDNGKAIDDSPVAGSNNLVKSGGIHHSLVNMEHGVMEAVGANGRMITDFSTQLQCPAIWVTGDNEGKWRREASFSGVMIPVSEGDTIDVVYANDEAYGYYEFLADCSIDGDSPSYVDDYEDNRLTPETSVQLIVPAGCKYLYIAVSYSVDVAPASVYIHSSVGNLVHIDRAVNDIGHLVSDNITVSPEYPRNWSKMMDVDIPSGTTFRIRLCGTIDTSRLFLRANSGLGTVIVGSSITPDWWYEYTAQEDISGIWLWHQELTDDISVHVEVMTGSMFKTQELEDTVRDMKTGLTSTAVDDEIELDDVAWSDYMPCSLSKDSPYYIFTVAEKEVTGQPYVFVQFYDKNRNVIRFGQDYSIQCYYGQNTEMTLASDAYCYRIRINDHTTGTFKIRITTTLYAVEEETGFCKSYPIVNIDSKRSTLLLDNLDIESGEKIFLRLVGTATVLPRLILRVNGRFGKIIKDHVQLGQWYEFTTYEDIDSLWMWHESEDLSIAVSLELVRGIERDVKVFKETGAQPVAGDVMSIDSNMYIGGTLSPLSSPEYGNRLNTLGLLSKKGFLVFRTDDNVIMPEVVAITEYFGYRYNMAINAVKLLNTEKLDFYRKLQQRGHEMCDHTPNDTTYYTDILPKWESIFTPYIGNGLRKIDDSPLQSGWKRVFFDFGSVANYEDYQYGETGGYSTVAGTNKIQGDFSIDGIDQTSRKDPDLNCLFVYIDSANGDVTEGWHVALIDSAEPGEILIVDGAGNELNFETNDTITLYLALNRENVLLEGRHRTIELTENGLYLLMLSGQLWWPELGFERPRTWIQNGGQHPMAYGDDLQNCIVKLAMNNGECISAPNVELTYGYADNMANPLACTFWGVGYWHLDEAEESWEPYLKREIADCVALKRVQTLASHYKYTNFEGGKDGFIKFVYNIFKFCHDNNIAFATFSERKRLLIDSVGDENVNIMPNLYTDICGRGYPDGYINDNTVVSVLDTENGMAESMRMSLRLTEDNRGNGNYIIKINTLGGVANGLNKFSFYYKGDLGSVTVRIEGKKHPAHSGTLLRTYTQALSSSDWQKYECEFNFQSRLNNYLNVYVTADGYAAGAFVTNPCIKKSV